jgi:hypothetical protein
MLSTGLWRWYIHITITILDIIHRLAFYLKQLNFIGFSVSHRKHITSPLWDQQVSTGLWRWYANATITILDITNRPVFYLKHEVDSLILIGDLCCVDFTKCIDFINFIKLAPVITPTWAVSSFFLFFFSFLNSFISNQNYFRFYNLICWLYIYIHIYIYMWL